MAAGPTAVQRIQGIGMDVGHLKPVSSDMAYIAAVRGLRMGGSFAAGGCAIVTTNTAVQRLAMIDLR
jgi:hypothetical protein